MQELLGVKDDKDFLEELVAHKFGAVISKTEANKLEKLTVEAIDLKTKVDKLKIAEQTGSSKEELAYGAKIIELSNAETRILLSGEGNFWDKFKKLKGESPFTLKGWANWAKYIIDTGTDATGATRSFLATGDVSAL